MLPQRTLKTPAKQIIKQKKNVRKQKTQGGTHQGSRAGRLQEDRVQGCGYELSSRRDDTDA